MRKKFIWIAISLVFLLAFVAFTYGVKEDIFNSLDFDITVRLQDNLPVKYDAFLSSFSLVGSFEVLAGICHCMSSGVGTSRPILRNTG